MFQFIYIVEESIFLFNVIKCLHANFYHLNAWASMEDMYLISTMLSLRNCLKFKRGNNTFHYEMNYDYWNDNSFETFK